LVVGANSPGPSVATSRPEGVVQHGREEPALDDANEVHELFRGHEGHLDGACVGVDGQQLPTE
jgi:hypothetical protein